MILNKRTPEIKISEVLGGGRNFKKLYCFLLRLSTES